MGCCLKIQMSASGKSSGMALKLVVAARGARLDSLIQTPCSYSFNKQSSSGKFLEGPRGENGGLTVKLSVNVSQRQGV